MTERDDQRVAKALQGVDFPADLDTLLDYAETRGADLKTLQALRTLPKQRYENMSDVRDSVAQEPEGENRPGGTAR